MNKLREVALVFLKLGSIAFGGPAAHIAMMQDEIVEKRKWMDSQRFLDLIGVTNLIPGPNSTEMTMHCGYERAGAKGLFLAGGLFIFPAVIISVVLGYLYVKYGTLPEAQPWIYGIKPAVIAIILSAVFKLGKKALKNYELGILGLITLLACLFGMNEILAMFICGILGMLLFLIKSQRSSSLSVVPFFMLPLSVSQLKVFLIFLKVGSILYGSGYVLFAFLETELVAKGLLSQVDLINAVAVGQITPGPVLSTATFIGYQLAGFKGALLATLGIFLPSFIFVWIINPLVDRIRKSKILSAFLDAVNVGAVAIILAVCYDMARNSITDWRTLLIALLSAVMVFYFKKINSAFIVIGSSLLGFLLTYL